MLDESPNVRSVEVRDTDPARLRDVSGVLGPKTRVGQGSVVPDGIDLVVVATTAGTQTSLALGAVKAGATVVTTTNEIAETRDLLAADQEARQHGVRLVVGAGYMPGLTCLLARVGAAAFDCGRRDPCSQGRNRRTGVRRPASSGAQQPGHRLAGRPLDTQGGRLGPRAVLVPRSRGRPGLLPGSPPGCVVARARLPRRRSGNGAHGRHASRSAHRAVADDAPPASRGRGGGGARGASGLVPRRAPCGRARLPGETGGRSGRRGGRHRAAPR